MGEIEIQSIGGNCPVQAEGRINGEPFYFRARGRWWSLSVGGSDVVGDPQWYHEEPWGEDPYSAGWMDESEARRLIDVGVNLYRRRKEALDSNRSYVKTQCAQLTPSPELSKSPRSPQGRLKKTFLSK